MFNYRCNIADFLSQTISWERHLKRAAHPGGDVSLLPITLWYKETRHWDIKCSKNVVKTYLTLLHFVVCIFHRKKTDIQMIIGVICKSETMNLAIILIIGTHFEWILTKNCIHNYSSIFNIISIFFLIWLKNSHLQ